MYVKKMWLNIFCVLLGLIGVTGSQILEIKFDALEEQEKIENVLPTTTPGGKFNILRVKVVGEAFVKCYSCKTHSFLFPTKFLNFDMLHQLSSTAPKPFAVLSALHQM